ncbi:MAG TPA: hypothetical protein VIN09_05055 [Chloroflexota bacterium]
MEVYIQRTPIGWEVTCKRGAFALSKDFPLHLEDEARRFIWERLVQEWEEWEVAQVRRRRLTPESQP